MEKIISEKWLEKKVVEATKSAGGEAIKLFGLLFTGLPDRLVLLPRGKVCFAETKSSNDYRKANQGCSPRQVLVIAWLRKLGFKVYIVGDIASLNEFKKSLKCTD